jgi:cobalamin biosynthesis protein CobW
MRPGVASMMADMLNRGTANRSFEDYNEAVDSLGAVVGAGAGRRDISIDFHALAEDLPAVLDLVSDLARNPTFPDDELERVRQQITALTPPAVKIISASRGQLPFDVVLGLQRASEDHIDERHTHHDEDHEQGKEHSHELFDTIVVRPPVLERAALLRGLEAVVREHEVYRAKGFAAIEGKPMRLVVQGVGRRFDSYFDRPWTASERRATELVFIGSHLDREALTRTLLAAAGA